MEIKFAKSHLLGGWIGVDEQADPGVVASMVKEHEAHHFSTRRRYSEFTGFQITNPGTPRLYVATKTKARDVITFDLSRLAFARVCTAVGVSRMSVRAAIKSGPPGVAFIEDKITSLMKHSSPAREPVTILTKQTGKGSYIVREILRPGDPEPFSESQLHAKLTEMGVSRRIKQVRFSDYGSSFLLPTSEDEVFIEVGTSLNMKTLYVQGVVRYAGAWVRAVGKHSRKSFISLDAIESAVTKVSADTIASLDEMSQQEEVKYPPLHIMAWVSRAIKDRKVLQVHQRTVMSEVGLAAFDSSEVWPTDLETTSARVAAGAMSRACRYLEDPEQCNRIERACFDILTSNVNHSMPHDRMVASVVIQSMGGDAASYMPGRSKFTQSEDVDPGDMDADESGESSASTITPTGASIT